MKGKLFTFSFTKCRLVDGDITALSWYFVVFFELFSIISSTGFISLRVKSERWELTSFFQSFNQSSRVFELHSKLLGLGHVINDRNKLVGCVATYVDCHEDLSFDFVVELSSEGGAKTVLVEE